MTIRFGRGQDLNKKCGCCKLVKSISQFSKRNDKPGYRSICRMCQAKYMVEYHKSNPLKVRAKNLKLRYKITLEDFQELHLKQSGKCSICGEAKELVVDHSHKTKIVRGLLCKKCNTAIGLLKEDKKIFTRCIEYLGL